jgi:hypothetical protein
MASVAFRLTIYQANGTTPDLTVTSVRGGTNPFIVDVPNGDGQEVDLLTGAVRSGAYNVRVADVVTGSTGTGTVRLVTSKLEDADYRQHLLSRRALLECSRDGGSTWEVWTSGYLTALRQTDAMTYEFTVSDSRRLESTHTAFTWWSDTNKTTDERREFPNRGCLVGGPMIQNFGPLRASGGWEFFWREVQSNYLALAFSAAYEPPSYARSPYFTVSRFMYDTRNFLQKLPPIATLTGSNYVQLRDREYVFGYPALLAMVTDGTNTWYGSVRAAFTPAFYSGSGAGDRTQGFDIARSNYVYVELDPGQSTSYPSTNARVRVRILQREVSEVSPVYIDEHPVDIAVKLYKTVGIPYNSASITSTKAAVGDDIKLALRITEPTNMGEFLSNAIFGPFGFSARTNSSGEQEFFPTRIANATAPTTTIAVGDIVGDAPPPVFEVDEGTVVTSFRLTAQALAPFVPDPDQTQPPPADGMVAIENTQVVQNADTTTFSTREVAYDIPGMVHDGSASGQAFVLSPEVVGKFFTGIVAEGFDRFGRGAIVSEVQVLAGTAAANLQVGAEVVLNIPYYPNKNYRIGESTVGTRIAQIVRRTEMPEGPIFKLVDSGVNQQPASPTFTVAAWTGDPRRIAEVTVTNASTLNSAGVTLAVQYQVSANTPTRTGTLFTRFRPGTIPTGPFLLPNVPPGSKVWVRMRTERTELRASAWTSWTSVTLDSWIAPTSLTAGSATANSMTLSWSLNSNTLDPMDVFVYPGGSAPADWTDYRLSTLSSGSTTTIVRDLLPSTQYTFGVAFRDVSTGAYSAFTTATATTAATNTTTCPAAPKMKVIPAFENAGQTTGVVLTIGAVEGYNIVVQRAPDSSGSPGTWADIAVLLPLTGYFADILPSDGITRWYRVFYRLSGFLDGAAGPARSATPIAIPDDLILSEGPSIISGGSSLTFGNYLTGTPDTFYDGSTAQTVAVDATSAATANKVVARDATGNFSANVVTATLDGAAPAGQLTGATLAANVLSSSLTSVGTIGTGVWQGTSVGKNYGGTGLTSSAFTGVTNERVFAYDGTTGAFFIAPSGSNGQALVYTGGALAWGNPAPGSHVLADTTGLGAQHTTSGLTTGMVLQATGATTARFQTPSIPASSVTAGTFSGTSYTITNDLTVSGILTASLPYSSITGKPSYFPADLTSVSGTLSKANGGTSNASWPSANSGEYVVIYDSVTGAERLEAGPQGTNGQALITVSGALTWGNPAPAAHVLATTTALGPDHTVSGLTSGMILQATGATTARFQTPSIPASSVTAGTFSGTSYTITNDLTVSGTLTGTLTGNITGNAATVTNGVYTNGSYADPSWITSLSGTKISGNISGNATNVTGTVAIANGGTNATGYGTSGSGTRAIVYDIGTNAFEAVSAGTSGQFLQSAGSAGDILWATPPNFTSTTAGYAPASGGGTTNFLRADGTWAVPSVGSVSANNVTAGTFSGATYTFSNSVTFSSGVRVAFGETYKILNGGGTAVDVLSATTLGSGVVNSSLTSVGTLTSGALGAGFTAIANARLANSSITINGTAVSLGGSITVDTSKWTSSGSNIYYSAGNVSIGTTPNTSIELLVRGGGTTSSTYGFLVENSAATSTFWVNDAGNVSIPNGNLGIGASPSSNRLNVNGTTSTTALVVNGTSAIGTASLSIYAGGSSGVAWGSGFNIGDSSSYLNFIQDVNISRWRNYGGAGYQWFTAAGSKILELSNAGLLSVTADVVVGSTYWYYGLNGAGTNQPLIRSQGMGYGPTTYPGVQIGQTGDHIALFVNPGAVSGGSFNGNINELLVPNFMRILQLNSGGTDWIEGMTFSNGNIGIGTTSPSYKLVVSNGGAVGGEFDASGTILAGGFGIQAYNRSTSASVPLGLYGSSITLGATTTVNGYVIFKDSVNSNTYGFRGLSGIITADGGGQYPTGWNLQYGGSSNSALYINSSGNVGIGTTSPQAKLAVQLDGTASSTINLYNNNGTNLRYSEIRSWFSPTDSSHTASIRFLKDVSVSGNYGSSIGFVTEADAGSQSIDYAMYIKNRNVGIGTTSPAHLLHVYKSYGGASLIARFQNESTTAPTAGYDTVHIIQNDVPTLRIIEYASSGSIHQDLSLGVGDGYGNLACSQPMRFWGGSPVNTTNYNGGGGTLAMTVSTGGNVLVGALTGWASSRLQVGTSSTSIPAAEFNGTGNTNGLSPVYVWNNAESGITYHISFYTDGINNARALRGYIAYRRNTNEMFLYSASDYRIKTVHGPYTKSGEIFDKIKIHDTTITGQTEGHNPMVLAHELQEAFPNAVDGEKDAVNEDGTPKLQMVSYTAMIPLMLAEIKSLRARVAELEAR